MKCDPVIGLANDYTFIDFLKDKIPKELVVSQEISIIIPYYNRCAELENTLQALALQTILPKNMDVIVVDDGSDTPPNKVVEKYKDVFRFIRVFSKKRNGFQLSIARNIGMKQAFFENILIIDVDILPLRNMIEEHLKVLSVSHKAISIGFRSNMNVEKKDVAELVNIKLDRCDLDWRVRSYFGSDEKTRRFKLGDTYWGACSGGNIAFSKKVVDEGLFFDESFNNWGAEDNVWAYEMYKKGFYFYPNFDAVSIHQEGLVVSKKDYTEDKRITGQLLKRLCPRIEGEFSLKPYNDLNYTPFVSFWVSSYNRPDFLKEALRSLEGFPFRHEIVIVDDGSSSSTLKSISEIIDTMPNVVLLRRGHAGISTTFQDALKLCRGEFIIQLDSDDRISNLNMLADIIFKMVYTPYGLAYGSYSLIDEKGVKTGVGWKYPYCERNEALFEGMRMHPPRVIRKRDLHRAVEINKTLEAAVDYDLYSKVLEVTYGFFIDFEIYEYRKHSEGVTKDLFERQGLCTRVSVEDRIMRLGLTHVTTNESENPRKNRIRMTEDYKKPIRFINHLGLKFEFLQFVDFENIPTEDLVDPSVLILDLSQKDFDGITLNNFRFEG